MTSDIIKPSDPLIGTEIGEYRITGILGRGGMGVVYAADDTALGIPVALKMIDPALARDASFVRRFQAEARAMARLPSPHIVRVMAMRQTEVGVFIVMEYVDGGTLHDRMQHGPMPWTEVWPYVREVLLALEKAHQVGVIHRDIKPRNIMLTADGTVKVTDFGLAKVVAEEAGATVTQGVAGTLLYMSPEQVRAASDMDTRADLFSLGLMLYEMLAGRLPFDRDAGEFAVMRAIAEEPFPPPTKFESSIPAPVARAVMKALEKDRDKRYANPTEMREALQQLANTPAATVKTRTTGSGLWRMAAMVLVAIVLVVALAGVILKFVLPGDDPDPVIVEQVDPDTFDDSDAQDVLTQTDNPTDGDGSDSQTLPDASRPNGPNGSSADPNPPPPPSPGTLAVTSTSGIEYTVNGRRIDDTVVLSAGTHTVTCTAGGYTAHTRVRISSGQTQQVACHAQQTVNISVSFEDGPSAWLTVLHNGRNAGQTPTRLTLEPGRHVIALQQRDNYEILTGEQVIEVRPSFEPLQPIRLPFRARAQS